MGEYRPLKAEEISFRKNKEQMTLDALRRADRRYSGVGVMSTFGLLSCDESIVSG